jgi:large subunit ribosomal protein L30
MADASTSSSEGRLKVTLVHSTIGAKPKARGTVRALGLRRTGASTTLPDRPEIRGMLAKVPHLVRVEPVDTAESGPPSRRATEAES